MLGGPIADAALTSERWAAYREYMRVVTIRGAALVVATLGVACGPGPVDQVEDFTEEVEQICTDFCELNFACRMPPGFDSYEECEHICLHSAFVYNDTVCGEATRAELACIASQPTCELYNDTWNVHADGYTCKVEKDHWAAVSESCGQSDEEPYPKGEP